MALKSLTSSPTLRMSRRVPSPLLDSPISEEDQRQVNSQESPYSAALARSASPTSTRQHKFIKRLNSRWLHSPTLRDSQDDGLDFGCIGVDVEESTETLESAGNSNRDSTYSSSAGSVVPSLLLNHSRTQSCSSDLSIYTADSSMPPSPTPSSSGSASSVWGPDCAGAALATPSPLVTSRVPFTPSTAQHKRHSDEAAALEALDHFFLKSATRLSRVGEEDISITPRLSVTTLVGRSRSSEGKQRALDADELLSQNHVNCPPARRSTLKPLDLEFQIMNTGISTYTPLDDDASFHYTHTARSPTIASVSSGRSSSTERPSAAVPRSPELDDENMSCALDELTHFFISPPTPSPTKSLTSSSSSSSYIAPARPRLHRQLGQGAKRPAMTASAAMGGLRIGMQPSQPVIPAGHRRVEYDWI